MKMISVTKLSGERITLNAELVITIESTPDTVISLTNGEKLLVSETEEEVVSRIIEYRRCVESKEKVLA